MIIRRVFGRKYSVKLIFNTICEKLLIFCGSLYVLLPPSPLNMPITYRDSGVFLYIGWRILHGELPYIDIWDHKPPIIFYINAFGLAIANHSRWGVWLLEVISIFIAAFIGFSLLKKAFGLFPAICSLLLLFTTLTFVIQGGNLTTEYTLPLQFFSLWLVYDADKPNFPTKNWFFIGLLGGVAFFTKQTSIGIWLAIFIYIFFIRLKRNQSNRTLTEILFFSGGVFLVCLLIILFFGSRGGLVEFWDATFQYNFISSSTNLNFTNRLESLLEGILPITKVGFFQMGLIGYILCIILILFKKNVIKRRNPLLLIGLIDFPMELILANVSGKSYPHYYMVILPILSVFCGFTCFAFFSQLTFWKTSNIIKIGKSVLQICILGAVLWKSFGFYKAQVAVYNNSENNAIISYIKYHTDPDDYVFLWGAESKINYFSQRKSPTRYNYQYPLYLQGFTDEHKILELLEAIIQNPPRLLIDTKNERTPMYQFPIQSKRVAEKVEFIETQYRKTEIIGSWIIYEYTGNEFLHK